MTDNNIKEFTLLFSFFCESEIRRKYLDLCVKSLFEKMENYEIPVLVIDGSSKNHLLKNKEVFKNIYNLTYIEDSEKNQLKRIANNINFVQTKYLFRVLEDCVFINFNCNYIYKDIIVMEFDTQLNAIQYPILNEQSYRIENDTIYYNPINFDKKNIFKIKDRKCYDRSDEIKIYYYLCNNLLYETNFFKKHTKLFSDYFYYHNSAESLNPDKGLISFLGHSKLARFITKILFLFFFKSKILKRIYVTETINLLDVLHIGYESTETNILSNPERELSSKQADGTFSVIKNLKIFSNITRLKKMKFARETK